jgi:hypothetical protein
MVSLSRTSDWDKMLPEFPKHAKVHPKLKSPEKQNDAKSKVPEKVEHKSTSQPARSGFIRLPNPDEDRFGKEINAQPIGRLIFGHKTEDLDEITASMMKMPSTYFDKLSKIYIDMVDLHDGNPNQKSRELIEYVKR